MSRTEDGIDFRDLAGVAELKEAEALQRTVWGESDPADNSDIMLAIQHEGGLVAGAFRDGRLLGFLFGFPTSRPHVQHSHRLAVHPDARGMGLGGRLKWYQRDWCLERGITLVRWTYDPLRRINASLNIAGLGATSATYYEDYYGPMEGINAGVPSDRLLVDWDLTSPRVAALAAGGEPVPGAQPTGLLRIEIPEDLDGLLRSDPGKALSERLRVREEMTAAFAKGYRVCGFDAAGCCYLLAGR